MNSIKNRQIKACVKNINRSWKVLKDQALNQALIK